MALSLCLAHLTVLELAPPEVITVAAQAGIPQVSLRLAGATADDAVPPMLGDTPMRRETLARMADTGVAVHDIELVRLDADSDVKRFEPLMEAAAALGARHLLVAGESADEARMADRFAELCELSRTWRLRAALEFMPWRGIGTLASALRVVDAAGDGGVLIDAIHLDRSGGRAADVAMIPPMQLAWFQICDAPAERPADQAQLLFQARSARLPPGEGGLDLAGMLRALPGDCVVSIEVPLHGRPELAEPGRRAAWLARATREAIRSAGLPMPASAHER